MAQRGGGESAEFRPEDPGRTRSILPQAVMYLGSVELVCRLLGRTELDQGRSGAERSRNRPLFVRMDDMGRGGSGTFSGGIAWEPVAQGKTPVGRVTSRPFYFPD